MNEQISIGGGPNVMLAYLKYTSNVNNLLPPGSGDGQMEVKDTTAGVGGQFGVLVEPKKGTRVGVTYYSPIKLDFSDQPHLLEPGDHRHRVAKQWGPESQSRFGYHGAAACHPQRLS